MAFRAKPSQRLACHLSRALLFLCALSATFARAADAKKAAKVTYDEHVLPILRDKCVGCHNPDKKRGGLVLNNYTRHMEGGTSGTSV